LPVLTAWNKTGTIGRLSVVIKLEGVGMTGRDDLAGLSEAQLVQAYVENVQSYEATDHVGVKNRLFDRRMKIAAELKTRDRMLLRALLDYPDPEVRSRAHWDIDDRPKHEPPPYSPQRWELQWQCDNPPPRAMTRA
jgi:hypothetical protein